MIPTDYLPEGYEDDPVARELAGDIAAGHLPAPVDYDPVDMAEAARRLDPTHPNYSPPAPDLADTLDEIAAWIDKYTVLPGDYTARVLALWAAHTYVSTSFYTTPRIVLSSPVAGSGKTRVLELLEGVVYGPKTTVNSTTAAIYRRISTDVDAGKLPPTLLYDEVDALFGLRPTPQSEDIRALLNAGYKKGATVDRCVGENNEVKEFPVFSPVALAGLAGHMPDTIITRAIVIEMKKRRRGEKITPYRERAARDEIADARAALTAWSSTAASDMKYAEPVMPKGVEDRPAEVWEPLLAVADAAGGHWPKTAREACREFVFAPEKRPPSRGIQLLSDIRQIMGHDPDDDHAPFPADSIRTTDLISRLKDKEEAGWSEMNGGLGPTSTFLANTLSGYDVRPVSIRDAQGSGKGYTIRATTKHGKPYQDGLADAWARYLHTPTRESGDSGDSGDTAGQTIQNLSPVGNPSGDTPVTRGDGSGDTAVTGDTPVTDSEPTTSTVTAVTAVTASASRGANSGRETLLDDTGRTILDALDTEFGLSPETVAGSVPGLSKDSVIGHLEALAAAGLVTVDHRNRYTRNHPEISA